jgi:predicted DNA-binding ribbon-helix-helix protein
MMHAKHERQDAGMNSLVAKRSLVIDGHKTSASLEEAFWNGLKEISRASGKPLSGLVSEIDRSRQGNLSSAIRLFVLNHFRTGAPPQSGPTAAAKKRSRRPSNDEANVRFNSGNQ